MLHFSSSAYETAYQPESAQIIGQEVLVNYCHFLSRFDICLLF